MFLIQHLTHYFTRYYLLAATASIIILGFIGSANVLFITAEHPSFMGWAGLFLRSWRPCVFWPSFSRNILRNGS
jgi:hypothetical protein